MKSTSLWYESVTMPHFSTMTEDISVDVCVVGGGIAGLTSAYLLLKEGKKVCILENGELCSGQTGRTTAHFSTALDDRYFNLEKYHGMDGAQLAATSHSQAIDLVIGIIQNEQIDCDLEIIDGYLFAADDERNNVLRTELKACHRAGLDDVEFLERSPLVSFYSGPCLRFPKQMKLHPLKYLKALTQAIVNAGGEIYTHTHVVSAQGGEKTETKTKRGFTVTSHSIIMATNTPINDRVVIHTKQSAYRSYVLGFLIPKGSVQNALYWDTLDPYHYIRIDQATETDDMLIVGGADHKTGQTDDAEENFKTLETWVRNRFPMAKNIVHQWSGQVMEPVDGLAYLGRNPMDEDNVYIITGDSGNGMTHCTIGAMLITDLIMGRQNPWSDLYSPNRISLRAAPEFIKENANVMAQYSEWLEAKSMPDFDHIAANEGVVLRHGLKIVAAYKNEVGEIKFISAACPHLGGMVHWNNVEKSWDCPCHGSRFNAYGKVIEGPALTDLEKIDFPMLRLDTAPITSQELT